MRRILVLAVVAMMVLSGCTGLGGVGGDDGTTATTTEPNTGGSGGGGDGGDGASSGDGSDSGDGEAMVDDFEDVQTERQLADLMDRSPVTYFRAGEYFRYEGRSGVGTNFEELQETTLTIESFEGGEFFEPDVQVTVVRGDTETVYERGDFRGTRNLELLTMAATRSKIFGSRWTVVSAVDPPRLSDLSVGDSWVTELQAAEEDQEPRGVIYTVTGTDTYAGVECTVIQEEFYEGEERRLAQEHCIAPDVGPVLYTIWYQNDGDVMMELELVEYRR